jgi:hypothetical protein
MTDAELLTEVKIGLGIPVSNTGFDNPLTQKLLTVKAFMSGAGVSDTVLASDLAVGSIVTGVTDIWKLDGGEIKYSTVFLMNVGQLAAMSYLLTANSNPADGDTGVTISVAPVLTFSNRITAYNIYLVKTDTQDSVSIDIDLNITGKVLTITPDVSLEAATGYSIVINSVTDEKGQTMNFTVISFTTA